MMVKKILLISWIWDFFLLLELDHRRREIFIYPAKIPLILDMCKEAILCEGVIYLGEKSPYFEFFTAVMIE